VDSYGDSLDGNLITDAGVSALGDALKVNTILTSLEYVSFYSVHFIIIIRIDDE
jgi:hypothetical protein